MLRPLIFGSCCHAGPPGLGALPPAAERIPVLPLHHPGPKDRSQDMDPKRGPAKNVCVYIYIYVHISLCMYVCMYVYGLYSVLQPPRNKKFQTFPKDQRREPTKFKVLLLDTKVSPSSSWRPLEEGS